MPNYPVPAAGEAVSAVSRRAILGGLVAIPASALPGRAAVPPQATDIIPALSTPPGAQLSQEELRKRIGELGAEIAQLLDIYSDGKWIAEIHPASCFKQPISYRRFDDLRGVRIA